MKTHMEEEHSSEVDKDQNKSVNEIDSTKSSLLKSFESLSEEEISHEAKHECKICEVEFIDLENLQ